MKFVRRGIFSAIVAVTLLASVPAMADPPPSFNPNTSVFTFDCSRGSETRTFQAIAILQSASIAGQLLDGNGVIVSRISSSTVRLCSMSPDKRGGPTYGRAPSRRPPELWSLRN
jgi:hypothetical protein